jgi:hypothetical protein
MIARTQNSYHYLSACLHSGDCTTGRPAEAASTAILLALRPRLSSGLGLGLGLSLCSNPIGQNFCPAGEIINGRVKPESNAIPIGMAQSNHILPVESQSNIAITSLTRRYVISLYKAALFSIKLLGKL